MGPKEPNEVEQGQMQMLNMSWDRLREELIENSSVEKDLEVLVEEKLDMNQEYPLAAW